MSMPKKQPASTPSDRVVIPVRVNLAEPHLTMARYAVSALLEPLSIRAEWVDGTSETGRPVFYYGPPELCSESEIPLAFDPRAARVLGGHERVAADQIRWMEWEGEMWPVLFSDASGSPDLVACTFYLLSGLDEIKSGKRDLHGRPIFEDSIQCRAGFADRPVVDAYRERFAGHLSGHGVTCRRRSWGGHSWAVCPTFDVDYLRKWRKGMVYREVVRNLVLNDRSETPRGRIRRFGDFLSDALRPPDSYRSALSRMLKEVRDRGGTATTFLKAGAHGPNDVGYSLQGGWLRRLVATEQAAGFEFGLHPSYYAHEHGKYLAEEVRRFKTAVGRAPRSVRQHYLRYRPAVTMPLHEEAGFEIDATLGFATHEGFRRSTSLPFKLFDPVLNRPSHMWEMPLIAMDGALFNRRHYSAGEAAEVTRRLMDQCKRFGGCAVVLWHNVLWDEMDAPGWGEHFLDVLDYAVSEGALISSLETALAGWRKDAVA